jgi:hypothetical protein
LQPTFQIERVVTKIMGNTSAKLHGIFDLTRDVPSVYSL